MGVTSRQAMPWTFASFFHKVESRLVYTQCLIPLFFIFLGTFMTDAKKQRFWLLILKNNLQEKNMVSSELHLYRNSWNTAFNVVLWRSISVCCSFFCQFSFQLMSLVKISHVFQIEDNGSWLFQPIRKERNILGWILRELVINKVRFLLVEEFLPFFLTDTSSIPCLSSPVFPKWGFTI